MRIQDIALLRVPNTNLLLLLRVAKSLVRDAPQADNAALEAALAKLITHIKLLERALVHRLRTRDKSLLARELEFDRAVDTLWIFLREYLRMSAHAFGHSGLDHLPEAAKDELPLSDLRELSELAAQVHGKVFGAEGTSFVKASLPQQAAEMSARLQLIEEDGLHEPLESCGATRIVDAIELCQAHYEDIVNARLKRDKGNSENLQEQRQRLRWLLSRYKLAVENLYDEDQPESEAVVVAALRPLVVVHDYIHRSDGRSSETLDEALVEAPDLDELAESLVLDELDGDTEIPLSESAQSEGAHDV